jgi:hypothetical protein
LKEEHKQRITSIAEEHKQRVINNTSRAIKQRETDIMLEEKKKEDLNIEHEVEATEH